jgi:hypothetical protein
MAKVNQEDALQNLDFKCARCQAECSKINVAEPEYGYLSKVDGSFTGPLCKNCVNQIPEAERVVKKLAETAFLVIIKPDGEGAYLSTDGITLPYLREPTFNDVQSACDAISRDVHDSLFAQKLSGQIIRGLSPNQKQSKILIPK